MIPDTVHDVNIICPICGRELAFKVTEGILIPVRFEIPLQLRDGHEISLNTTHYNETSQEVSRLILVVITHCPGENK